MQKITLILIVAAACSFSQPSTAKITSQSVLNHIKVKGAPSILREYTSGSAQKWHYLLKQIETGDSGWLTVASELRSASDASYSEDLGFLSGYGANEIQRAFYG